MNTYIFYLAAVSLCGLSTILIHNATAYTVAVQASAAVRTRCRFVGRVLIAIAAVSAGIGAVSQYSALLQHH
jgi:hypothetical protein